MKLLVIRMSSMGDVILATSFLESLPADTKVDWVIAKEFAFILKNHPRIQNLIEFDKSTGFRGWIKLIEKLSHEEYDARVDLHVTLRSQIARVLFHWFDLSKEYWIPWKKISKQRFNFYGYLIFKRLWPSFLRPTPMWKRFARLAIRITKADAGLKPPSMLHRIGNADEALKKYALTSKKYFVVMPSSRWPSKEWGAEHYFQMCLELARKNFVVPVILGREQDASAQALTAKLKAGKLDHRSILSESDFSVTSSLIQNALFYVGSDTGLAHLAEAVGTPALMIFGPTRPDLGFGPWSEKSVSIHSNVICSPCSKDGRICYRFTNRYACLKKISSYQVVEQVEDKLP